MILGACNPALADRALHAELEIGLLLVQRHRLRNGQQPERRRGHGAVFALGIVGHNPVLQDVAREADERLRRALAALEASPSA